MLEAGTGTRSVDAAAAFAGEALRFAVSGAGASVDPLTGVVAIPTDAEVADAPVTVTASNSGGSATTGFRVTVAAPLAAPVAVGGIPDQILEQDSGPRTVSAQAAFRGEALGFALDAAPAGVGIDAGSGLVTIATDTALAAAPVIVRASNAAGAATQGFAVSVRSTVTAFDAGEPARRARLHLRGGRPVLVAGGGLRAAGAGGHPQRARRLDKGARRRPLPLPRALGRRHHAADGQPAVLALRALPPGRRQLPSASAPTSSGTPAASGSCSCASTPARAARPR